MSDAWNTVTDCLDRRWPAGRWADVGVVVGCSGGADSVALLRALEELRRRRPRPRGSLLVAHFNHGLRGKEADADEQFTAELARRLGCPFHASRCGASQSDEASLRQTRYRFLRETAERFGARYVAVAHHADDNAETLLHHLFRGSGPAGLCGIPPFRNLGPDLVVARPLLDVRRQTIRAGLRELGQPWREDRTNTENRYRRNWLRRDLFPLIESQYPGASDAVIRTVESLSGWREVLDEAAERWLAEAVTLHAQGLTVSREAPPPEAVVIHALAQTWDRQGWPRRAMGTEHWKRLAETIRQGESRGPESASPIRYHLPGRILVESVLDEVRLGDPSRADGR